MLQGRLCTLQVAAVGWHSAAKADGVPAGRTVVPNRPHQTCRVTVAARTAQQEDHGKRQCWQARQGATLLQATQCACKPPNSPPTAHEAASLVAEASAERRRLGIVEKSCGANSTVHSSSAQAKLKCPHENARAAWEGHGCQQPLRPAGLTRRLAHR